MLSLLEENSGEAEVRSVAWRSTKALTVAMLVVFFAGTYLFNFFGIDPNAIKVFGGIILIIMGYNMIQGYGKRVNHSPKEQLAAMEREDIAIVPLAIPIAMGAGLATTLISISVEADGWMDYLSASLAIFLCSVAYWQILRNMPYIKRALGYNGLRIFNRIMGLVVGSLAAQMIVNGVVSLYQINFS